MKVPSEKEIESLEKRLIEMRAARKQVKQEILGAIKSEDFFKSLDSSELASLFRKLQNYVRGTHKRTRGSPVPDELKNALIATLMDKDRAPSLASMANSFGLSVSYISRIKKELKHNEPIQNAYDDQQLQHQVA